MPVKGYTVYYRAKENLKRGLNRASAEISRPLLYQKEEEFTAIYPEPLPGGAIRLLTILDTENGKLSCRLDTYPLDLAPRYDAVSYCWGDDTATTSIVCNGFELQVRLNLMAFLKASNDRKPPLRPLWIDAICLNQEDNAEKKVQVPLMNSIYKHASRTIVWLGEPDEHSDLALLWLIVILPKWLSKGDSGGLSRDIRIKVCDAEAYPAQWKAIGDYLSRPWFKRLWCLQEVLLSQDIHVLCHTEKFPVITWKQLNQSMAIIGPHSSIETDYERYDQNGFRFAGADGGTAGDPQFMEYFRGQLRRRGYLWASTLRFFIQSRHCCEPVDRVWGLLGLLPPKFVTMVHEAGIVDYSEEGKRAYWRTYLNFMKVLHAFDDVDFFELIFDDLGCGRNTLLPSWCPDFTCPNSYAAFGASRRKFRAGFVNKQDCTAIESTLSPNGNLSVLGFQVDTVDQVTPAWRMMDPRIERSASDTEEVYREVQEWLMCCRRLWDATKDQSEGIKSLCCTLLAADRSGNEETSYSISWLRAHEALERRLAGGDEENDDDEQKSDGEHDEHYPFSLMTTCDGRRMFTTKNGRIGLGPPELQGGDIICTFMGAEPLFALRATDMSFLSSAIERRTKLVPPPCSSRFKLLGDAYMYGLMYGEAFTAPERKAKQDFVLV